LMYPELTSMLLFGNGAVEWENHMRRCSRIRSRKWNYQMNRFDAWTMQASNGVCKTIKQYSYKEVLFVFILCAECGRVLSIYYWIMCETRVVLYNLQYKIDLVSCSVRSAVRSLVSVSSCLLFSNQKVVPPR
jgi:hypothetical protein